MIAQHVDRASLKRRGGGRSSGAEAGIGGARIKLDARSLLRDKFCLRYATAIDWGMLFRNRG